MIRKLKTFCRLTSWEQGHAIGALGLMTAVRIALWTLPFRWIRRVVEACHPTPLLEGRASEAQVCWAVRLASRYVPCATCLTQALTAQMLLGWSGTGSKLHIGVRLDTKFEAHAWVECSGRTVVGESEVVAGYVPIFTLDRSTLPN
jgi:hypothetical protein